MTAKIQTLYQHPAIRRDIADAMIKLSNAINDAVSEADAAGVPMILVGTILNDHARLNSTLMFEEENGDE